MHSLSSGCCPICGSERIDHWGVAPNVGYPEVEHDLAKCSVCKHIFVDPLPSAEYLANAYKTNDPNVVSGDYFESRSNGAFSVGDNWYCNISCPGRLPVAF